ncbi:MAG: AEC family transporter, partial [Lachnospiraceae bacterium]|nr:AEC family transporter [Candidatus Equihabitans merdae]
LVPIRLPGLITEAIRYAGNAVTFMSIFIIGLNLAGMEIKTLIKDKQSYGYIIFRQILIPIAFMMVMKQFISDPAILGAFTVSLAVPVANMPSIMGRVNGCQLESLTKVTVMTTFFSVITMTFVMIVVMG